MTAKESIKNPAKRVAVVSTAASVAALGVGAVFGPLLGAGVAMLGLGTLLFGRRTEPEREH